jgi:hypothetical protein
MTDFSHGVSALAALFVVHLLAVASPGPAFLAVSRTAISSSRAAGVVAASGMATGALIWAIATLFGLDMLFAKAPWLTDAPRQCGTAIYLGVGTARQRMSTAVPWQWLASRCVRSACSCHRRRRCSSVPIFGLLPAAAPMWVKCAALASRDQQFGFYDSCGGAVGTRATDLCRTAQPRRAVRRSF